VTKRPVVIERVARIVDGVVFEFIPVRTSEQAAREIAPRL